MYVLTVPTIDIGRIFAGGQLVRWQRLKGLNDRRFVAMHGKHAAKIEQFDSRLTVSCTDERFYDVWFKYFDLSTDYADLNSKAVQILGNVGYAASRQVGLHIVNQDPYEALITSQLWSKCSPLAARLDVEWLCKLTGERHELRLRDMKPLTWHEFPEPERVMTDIDLIAENMGECKAELIFSVVEPIYHGWLDPWALPDMSAEDAMREIEFYMEPLQAQRALLWSGHHDVIVESKLMRDTVTWDYDCESVEEFKEWHLHELRGNEGYVSACMTAQAIDERRALRGSCGQH